MKTFYLLYHLARADFLERVRRPGLLILLAATAYLGYTFLPPPDAIYKTITMGDSRGIYNSAWVGGNMAAMCVVFLSLFGFYLVKNAVARDERTGVGQILAATPIQKHLYLLGKALSNFAVLSSMILALILIAAGMQLLRGEDMHIRPWLLVAPFLIIVLPVMGVVAALAVLFESIRPLKGGLGNVAYYFLWNGLLGSLMIPLSRQQGALIQTPFYDFLGVSIPLAGMQAAARAALPGYDGSFSLGYRFDLDANKGAPLTTFVWEGVNWTPEILLGRLFWFGVAFVLTLLSSLFFDRFGSQAKTPKEKKRENSQSESTAVPAPAALPVSLTPLVNGALRMNFWPLLLGELRLMRKDMRWWWLVVAAGLSVASLFAPLGAVRAVLFPIAWVWPILIWSPIGTKETYHRTDQLLFSTPFPLKRQLPALWAAGFIVTLLTGAGAGLHFLLSGEAVSFAGWLVGALFIPSLALSLGVWSGTSKLFEVVYLIIWYVGPVNKLPLLDFMGVTPQAIASNMPAIFLLVSAILLGLAAVGRKRQLQV